MLGAAERKNKPIVPLSSFSSWWCERCQIESGRASQNLPDGEPCLQVDEGMEGWRDDEENQSPCKQQGHLS